MFKTFDCKKKLLTNVILDVLEFIDTPFSLSCSIRLRCGVLETLTIDPSNFLDHESYLSAAQCRALFHKNPYLDSAVDLEQVAIDKFFQSEEKCRISNLRLTTIRNQENLVFNRMLSTARDFILSIIGERPDELNAFRFGPGATTSLRSTNASLIAKVSHSPEVCSSGLWPLCTLSKGTLYEQTIFKKGFISIRNHNIFTSVPKDARGNRGIAIEPDGNMVIQLSLGDQLRSKLRRHGYDLDFLQDHHRYFAEKASRDGLFATIDLSSASDCISSGLVKRLLPIDWWCSLNRARSPSTLIDGNVVHLEKFSSMGNGFTFELETLVFLSFCHAASHEYGRPLRGVFHWTSRDLSIKSPHTVKYSAKNEFFSVFGDDIICRVEHADLLIRMLKFCGLDTNTEKTFTSGPFRESCGGDFFSGVDVRPIFFSVFNDGVEGLYQLYNRVCRISEKLFGSSGCFTRACFRILACIPKYYQFFGPLSNHDNWLISDDVSRYLFSKKRRALQVNLIRCLFFEPDLRPVFEDTPNLLMYCLLGGSSKGYATRAQIHFVRQGCLHELT